MASAQGMKYSAHRGKGAQKSGAEEEKSNIGPSELGIKYLDFSGLESIFKTYLGKAKLSDPFKLEEISLTILGEPTLENINDLIGKNEEMFSYTGNKPFNVLLGIHLLNLFKNDQEKYIEYRKYFDLSFKPVIDAQLYIDNMKLILFSYLLLMTRGNVPIIDSQSKENNVPKLIKDNLKSINLNNENDLAKSIATFDLGKIDLKWMLNVEITLVPDIIRNRISKGTAGSRALKIIAAAAIYEKSDLISDGDNEIFEALADKARKSNCYLNMHPLRQVVQSKIPDFYRSCVALSALYVGRENLVALRDSLIKIPTFQKDKVLNDIMISNDTVTIGGIPFAHKFAGFDKTLIDEIFGQPLL